MHGWDLNEPPLDVGKMPDRWMRSTGTVSKVENGMTKISDTAGRRVVVAMSGGVDSSVVAGLLKAAGHDVIGITMQLYDHGQAVKRSGSCCAGDDIHDARQVAAKLAIPHYVLDYEHRFKKAVMEPFASSYAAGETPIPCIACNQNIKFHDLLDAAIDLGADYLATGHYVERLERPEGPSLRQPVDGDRDQSYFLFATTRHQLSKLWFPLGGMTKAEVRELATQFGLPVAEKKDSQDICFVPAGRYSDVVERLKPSAVLPGQIVHTDGRVLGTHKGIVNFTVGQRRGLGVAFGEPLFVVKLDAEHRRVIVGERHHLEMRTLGLRSVNWIGSETDAETARRSSGLDLFVKIRSTGAAVPATLFLPQDGSEGRVELHAGEFGVARGQACVFYDGSSGRAILLGGGWIDTTHGAL